MDIKDLYPVDVSRGQETYCAVEGCPEAGLLRFGAPPSRAFEDDRPAYCEVHAAERLADNMEIAATLTAEQHGIDMFTDVLHEELSEAVSA